MGIAAMLVMWLNSFVKIFISYSPSSFHMNFGSKSPHCFWKKKSFNFEIWVTFDQNQRMTLTFDTHSTS